MSLGAFDDGIGMVAYSKGGLRSFAQTIPF